MEIDSRTGLVLEGGGMRAIFTVGVLDCFMDHDIWFPYTIGVSAGASNGISYASRQRGRSRFSNIDLLEKYDYIGFRHFLRGRGYIDMKYPFLYLSGKILSARLRDVFQVAEPLRHGHQQLPDG